MLLLYYRTTTFPLWILFNFGEPRTFSTLSMTTLNFLNQAYHLKAGDIWYGKTATPDGDFSNFAHFASFDNFNNAEAKEITKQKPVKAQYLGIKQNNGIILYLCSISVY